MVPATRTTTNAVRPIPTLRSGPRMASSCPPRAAPAGPCHGRIFLVELNPFSHEFHEDPYPVYRELRNEAPCYYNAELDFYALTRYADVVDASQQPAVFSSAEGTTVERLDTQALLPMMIFMDPPEHDVNRRLVSRAFTARSVAALEPF